MTPPDFLHMKICWDCVFVLPQVRRIGETPVNRLTPYLLSGFVDVGARVRYKLDMAQRNGRSVIRNVSGWALVLIVTAVAIAQDLSASMDSPMTVQIFRAADWRGGTDTAFEGCKANSGEYTLWVYATATICGVPREQADRVVMFRQPLPGVSPLRGTSHLPEGRYAAWLYGAGDPGHPWVNLCAKTCVKGELPPTPHWVLLGWLEVRAHHQLLLKTWDQPDGHQLYIQAVVLSKADGVPEWIP